MVFIKSENVPTDQRTFFCILTISFATIYSVVFDPNKVMTKFLKLDFN